MLINYLVTKFGSTEGDFFTESTNGVLRYFMEGRKEGFVTNSQIVPHSCNLDVPFLESNYKKYAGWEERKGAPICCNASNFAEAHATQYTLSRYVQLQRVVFSFWSIFRVCASHPSSSSFLLVSTHHVPRAGAASTNIVTNDRQTSYLGFWKDDPTSRVGRLETGTD